MPYQIKKVKKGEGAVYKVFKKGTSKSFSKEPMTKEKAKKQIAALHINANENTMKKISKLRELIAESVREVLAEKKIEPNKKKKTKSTTEKEAEKRTRATEKENKSYIKKKYGNKFDTMLDKPTIKLKEILNDED
jgi:hypothetical protein